MAQVSYGTITINDITDISNVFLQYGKAISNVTVTNDYTFSGTGEIGWFTAATGTVDTNTIYFQLVNGIYKVVSNPSSTTGLYVSSPYPTWSSGFQIWIRQVTIKEGIDEPEYGTPYLDTAVNQINNTINIINSDLSDLTQRTGRFWTNEEARRNGQTYDGVVWTKPDYLAGTYLAQGLSNFAYNDATTYGYNTFYGNGIVLRYNQYPLTTMNHEGIQINAPTLDNNNKINGSTKGTVIDSTGMEIFKYDAAANNGSGADISVAKFGSGIRIGVENAAHINVTSGGLDLYNGATQASNLIAHLGYNSSVNSGNTPYFTFGTRSSQYSTIGLYSVAEGYETSAQSGYSHTEGFQTRTQASDSSTKFWGAYSHAEGLGSITTNGLAHAEGYQTQANGLASHVEGYATIANGDYSHASGLETIANGNGQFVCGKYNIEDSNSMFILGNGTDDNNRSNLMTVGDNYIQIGDQNKAGIEISVDEQIISNIAYYNGEFRFTSDGVLQGNIFFGNNSEPAFCMVGASDSDDKQCGIYWKNSSSFSSKSLQLNNLIPYTYLRHRGTGLIINDGEIMLCSGEASGMLLSNTVTSYIKLKMDQDYTFSNLTVNTDNFIIDQTGNIKMYLGSDTTDLSLMSAITALSWDSEVIE